jgi:hypothetical protein
MELKIIRQEFYENTTIGEMFIDNKRFSFVLEDKDRGYSQDTPKHIIDRDKIIGLSAIPYGKYRVVLSYSKKLKRFLPLILDVPLGKGIRIHYGTSNKYTSGCPLIGYKRLGKEKFSLKETKQAEKDFMAILEKANKTEAIYITIEKQ